MKRSLVLFASAAVLAAMGPAQVAWAAERDSDQRRSMGNLRPDHRTATPAIQGSPPPGYDGHRRPTPHEPDRYGYRGRHYPRHNPYYGGGYGYHHYYPPGYVYDPFCPSPYPWYPPPLYIPGERLYGPQAMKRFMGVDAGYSLDARPRIIVLSKEDKSDDDEPVARKSNDRSMALGWRFIGFGDAHFGNQKYADAYQRYRKAVESAPTLADAHFRQGFASIAVGNYDQAAKSIKKGLEIDSDWADSDFRIADLYDENRAAKSGHLDALAQAAANAPEDADLLFLVGVFLHFDDQKDRARPFFERAARVAAADAGHLRGFLR